jgi:hypothetical protein
MKARPRSVERSVAEFLSNTFSDAGYSPVKRIPVLGRTGPDIEINELGYVIDVKSRKQVPKMAFPQQYELLILPARDIRLVAFRLCHLKDHLSEFGFGEEFRYRELEEGSDMVADYFFHMDEWTKENRPDGTTSLILHKPRMPIGHSAFVIQFPF